MKLSYYQPLIRHLPVREQSFTTKRSTWNKAENENLWLKKLNNHLFKQNDHLTLNRQDVFDSGNLNEKIIKCIYWGYPRGKRGNHFSNILKSFQILEEMGSLLKHKGTITSDEYFQLTKNLKTVEGLGLSTFTKILYFLDIKIDNNPCLILDQRVINVIQANQYNCLSYISINSYNKVKKYPEYLDLLNRISRDLGTKPENLEQFLFLFSNLKPPKKFLS